MPSGWFEQGNSLFAGHPFVLGVARFPRLGLGWRVEFLVDTGCSVTTIHPRDSQAMGMDFSLLRQAGIALGIGGGQREFVEEAELVFFHGTQIVTYRRQIDIAPISDHNRVFPSLLGMDVIRHWRMVCDVHDDELSFDVHHADDIRELGTTP